ncbi:MAG TPA: HIT domain-containing protein [Candidatus Saccharimonadales bacterium]|jgi:diadenosine tetraphosphate (Ap4A) HIT family hydrolase|nr:HIT domain-containing protein [Candidatus Saccharimonadales bacterium]
MALDPKQQKKQELYRDARLNNEYDDIWQSVGKCVFCDLRDKYIFFEENGIVMTVPLYAYIDGHLMIVPRRHLRSAKEFSPLEWETIRKFMYIAKRMIKDVHGIKGMQFLQKDGNKAQSTVEHIHFHCIPFDAPDLSVWDYRKLTYTPVQNASLYKRKNKQLKHLSDKFDQKYKDGS